MLFTSSGIQLVEQISDKYTNWAFVNGNSYPSGALIFQDVSFATHFFGFPGPFPKLSAYKECSNHWQTWKAIQSPERGLLSHTAGNHSLLLFEGKQNVSSGEGGLCEQKLGSQC